MVRPQVLAPFWLVATGAAERREKSTVAGLAILLFYPGELLAGRVNACVGSFERRRVCPGCQALVLFSPQLVENGGHVLHRLHAVALPDHGHGPNGKCSRRGQGQELFAPLCVHFLISEVYV